MSYFSHSGYSHSLRRSRARADAMLHAVLDQVPVDMPPDPRRLEILLAGIFRSMLRLHTRAPRLHRAIFDRLAWPEPLRTELHLLEEHMSDVVADLLAALPEFSHPQPRHVAWILVEVTQALAHEYVLHQPEGLGEDLLVEEVVRLLHGYLTPR